MKSQSLPFTLALFAGILPGSAQETVRTWDVEIPPPVVAEAPAKTVEKPAPIGFEVLGSRTREIFVSKAPEMAGLPRVEGTAKVTVQRVAPPQLSDSYPLPVLPPGDPAVLARMEVLREIHRESELVFLSASVYLRFQGTDETRTLLRIYPNAQIGEEVVAWSNVNFLHLTGHGGYRVTHPDGTVQNMGLQMGISPMVGAASRRREAGAVRDGGGDPEIPALPDLAAAGPAFVVINGETGSLGMDVLEQLHDLFRKSGGMLEEQYLAREKAREERRAYLLANPPKPDDVTLRVWRRTRSANPQEESR